jgi:4-hydroxy-4-methyl-2-oxoglutarate aldolase
MITDPPLLRIQRNFLRPKHEVVKQFTGAATGHLVDAMGGAGALDIGIKPLDAINSSFCGVALTCNAGPADNLAVFAALQVAQPGDVLVAATGSYLGAAVTGDLLVGMARNCGAIAFVTDGVVRDGAGLRSVGLPIFSRGLSPNSPARNGPGTVGVVVVVGGVTIESGDILVGDEDGVVVIPCGKAEETARKLAEVRTAEALLEAKVKAGLRVPDFVSGILADGRTEFLP